MADAKAEEQEAAAVTVEREEGEGEAKGGEVPKQPASEASSQEAAGATAEPAIPPQEDTAAPQQGPEAAAASPMRRIYLEKVVLNMGMGRSGEPINIAKQALEQITSRKPCARDAHDSQRDWGVRKGEPIGVSVTVRGRDAHTLLRRLLDAKGNTISGRSFDNFGNYSFGIAEHIDIPGVKYEPKIGILGLGVSVSLARPGYSIRKRSKHKASIGRSHAITSREAKTYMASEFGTEVS